MVSILLCATPANGHVVPMVALGRQLVDRGHRVRMLTGPTHADRVRDAGLEPLALHGGADVDLDDPTSTFPERDGLGGIKGIRFDLLHLFLEPVVDQLAALEQAVAAEPTDVVVAEFTFVGAAVLATRPRHQRPAVVGAGVIPLVVDGPGLGPVGLGLLPKHGLAGGVRNRMVRLVGDRMMAPVNRRWAELQRQLAIDEPAKDVFASTDWLDAIIQFTVPGFEYPRPGRDDLHLVGPVTRNLVSGIATPDWWDELDGQRPVVHVTQGTIANRDLGRLVGPTLEALADLDVLVVASLGHDAGELPGPVPPNARVAEQLPYDLLMPRTSVFVTNGGYGGVHHALEHGVPVVVAGRSEDKVEVAARIRWSGSGVDLRTDTPRPARIRRAVERMLEDPTYRQSAQALSDEIERAAGMDEVERILTALATDPVAR